MAGALQSCFMFHNLLLRNNSQPHLSITRPYKMCIFIQRSFILAKIYIVVVPLGIRWMKDKVSLQDHSESTTILFHMAWEKLKFYYKIFKSLQFSIRKLKNSLIGRFYRVFNFTPLGIRKTEDKVLLQELPVSSMQVVR